MWLVKKFMLKLSDFDLKLIINDKNDKNHGKLNIKILQKKLLEKFQCFLFLNLPFYGGKYFSSYFDTTMTLSSHFLHYMHDIYNVIISKVHYGSNFFIHNFNTIPPKVYPNIFFKKMLILNMTFNLKFNYNLKK